MSDSKPDSNTPMPGTTAGVPNTGDRPSGAAADQNVDPASAGAGSVRSALAEVVVVYALFAGVLWGMGRGLPSFMDWQETTFGHPLLVILASAVLVPLLFLWLRGGRDPSSRLTTGHLKEYLREGGKGLNVMMPVTFLSFPVAGMLGYGFYDWNGGLYIAFWHLAALPFLCLLYRKRDTPEPAPLSRPDLLKILALFLLSVPAVWALHQLHPKAAGILVALIFIGQAEEFLFRGYMQGRLNRAMGRPFTILGYSFGWGLVLTALLFGLMHVLSPGNPFHWAWGVWTFAAGLGFGIIRDKSGSHIGSGLVHGIIMIFPVFFS